MAGYKILNMILGALMIVAGFYCCANPGLTTMSLGWLVGTVMVVNAIARLVTYRERKKLGMADGWSLASSIISLVLGILLYANNAMGAVASLVIVYFVAGWVLVAGILNIGRAIWLHRVHDTLDTEVVGSQWGWTLALGILLVITGIVSFVNPSGLIFTIGWLIGFELIAMGFNLFVASAVI